MNKSDNGARDFVERPLPHEIDAERSILGAIILDNKALCIATGIVNIFDFFLPQHRKILASMELLAGAGTPIDTVLIVECLSRNGWLEEAGGAAYVSQLTDGLARVTSVEHYARIVKDKAILRTCAYQASAILEDALAPNAAAAEVLQRAEEWISKTRANAKLSTDWHDVFHTWEEFENAPPLSFAIEDILQLDTATIIGGLSGHSKTFAMLSMTGAVLAGPGVKLWGHFSVREAARRVLYLIPESSVGPFGHRLKLFGLMDYVRDGRLLVRTLSKGPTPNLDDPRILSAAEGSYVVLDTAIRFAEGDENSAGDNQRGLATDFFGLLSAGARLILAAQHAPKSFATAPVMTLENILRGSGDVGAMAGTVWGVRQVDAARNIVHIENVKPRDFLPPGPFQIIGRPYIDEEGDFRMFKPPGQCGSLADEIEPARDRGGGAPIHVREAKAANMALLGEWLKEDPSQTSEALAARFEASGISLSPVTVRKYRSKLTLRSATVPRDEERF